PGTKVRAGAVGVQAGDGAGQAFLNKIVGIDRVAHEQACVSPEPRNFRDQPTPDRFACGRIVDTVYRRIVRTLTAAATRHAWSANPFLEQTFRRRGARRATRTETRGRGRGSA